MERGKRYTAKASAPGVHSIHLETDDLEEAIGVVKEYRKHYSRSECTVIEHWRPCHNAVYHNVDLGPLTEPWWKRDHPGSIPV